MSASEEVIATRMESDVVGFVGDSEIESTVGGVFCNCPPMDTEPERTQPE